MFGWRKTFEATGYQPEPLPGLLHPLERRRPRHPHPEGSQGGIREAAIESFGTVLYDRTVRSRNIDCETGYVRLKRGLVAWDYEGVLGGFLEHDRKSGFEGS